MKRGFAIIALGLALSGCVTTAEEMAGDDQKCHSYGFASGTQGLAQCRLTLDTQRQQKRAAAADTFADGLDQASQNYSQRVNQTAAPSTIMPSCADGYACAGRSLQGDGRYH